MQADVVVLTALGDEFRAVHEVLERRFTPLTRWEGNRIYQGLGGITIALAPQLQMGQLCATLGTTRAIDTLSPRLIVLVGIAACIAKRKRKNQTDDNDPRLGDLVIAKQVIDYELQKIRPDREVERRPEPYRTSDALMPRLLEWHVDETWLDEFTHPRPRNDTRRPRAHFGTVLSGNSVVADNDERERLREAFSRAIALEMEAAGVAAAIAARTERQPHFLMVKAFTDWGDGSKNDEWRAYACALSAEFTGAMLKELIPKCLTNHSPREDDSELFRRRCTRTLQQYLASGELDGTFVPAMANSILDEALTEIGALISTVQNDEQVYRAELSANERYLTRARPFFNAASRIYATSLDWVSTFWRDARTASQYLASQPSSNPERVARLFVFSSPELAHYHVNRLDAHAQRFPNTFVCSRDAYEQLLSCIVAPDATDYLQRDFAILDFQGDGVSQSYFAELDPTSFEFTRARYNADPEDLNLKRLIEVFEELTQLQPSGWHEGMNILKWDPRGWRDKDWWAGRLAEMFGERTADVFHTISFNITEKEYHNLRKAFAELKYTILDGRGELNSLAKRHGVKDVWLVRRMNRNDPPVLERHTRGALYYPETPRLEYVIMMRLSDSEKLDAFLRDDANLKLRLDLWSALGGLVTEAMAAWEMRTPSELQKANSDSKLRYEALERFAAEQMRRYDYVDVELIREIVEGHPWR